MNVDWQALETQLRKRCRPQQITKFAAPLCELLPPTQRLIGNRITPVLNEYMPEPLPPPVGAERSRQEEFLLLADREAFYGGAGGGGKSMALLLAALQFVHVPGYNALLIRRTFKELNKPGALLDLAHKYLAGTAAIWRGEKNRYEFPSGATLTFGYMESESDKYQYTGSSWQFIGFDELTQFTESQYSFLFGWLRRLEGMRLPLRMRSASNPIGPGRLWVKTRLVDPWRRGDAGAPVFMPATIKDNVLIDEAEYVKSMLHMDPIDRERVLKGDWDIMATGKFRREWFKILPALPVGLRCVRYWDLAATEVAVGKDPSWTSGVKMGTVDGQYFIADVVRARLTPRGVENLILQTAAIDGPSTAIHMEQEPGSAGVRVIYDFARLLAGYDFKGDKVTGPRELRANGLASQAEAGNVFLLSGAWNKDLLDELEVFPGGGHDDQVVAASGAFNALTGVLPVDTSNIITVGQRLRPDW